MIQLQSINSQMFQLHTKHLVTQTKEENTINVVKNVLMNLRIREEWIHLVIYLETFLGKYFPDFLLTRATSQQ